MRSMSVILTFPYARGPILRVLKMIEKRCDKVEAAQGLLRRKSLCATDKLYGFALGARFSYSSIGALQDQLELSMLLVTSSNCDMGHLVGAVSGIHVHAPWSLQTV